MTPPPITELPVDEGAHKAAQHWESTGFEWPLRRVALAALEDWWIDPEDDAHQAHLERIEAAARDLARKECS